LFAISTIWKRLPDGAKRLNGEALEEYVKPIGGGYFFVLPGVIDSQHYLGNRCSKPDVPARKGRAFSVFPFFFVFPALFIFL
jgi:hypothetical protein